MNGISVTHVYFRYWQKITSGRFSKRQVIFLLFDFSDWKKLLGAIYIYPKKTMPAILLRKLKKVCRSKTHYCTAIGLTPITTILNRGEGRSALLNKTGSSAYQPLHIQVMWRSAYQPLKNKVIYSDYACEYSRNLSVLEQKHRQKSRYSWEVDRQIFTSPRYGEQATAQCIWARHEPTRQHDSMMSTSHRHFSSWDPIFHLQTKFVQLRWNYPAAD